MILNLFGMAISNAQPKLRCDKSLWICRGFSRQIYRLLSAALALGSLMTASAWAAPEEMPAWPSESALISAIKKDVKESPKSVLGLSIRSVHPLRVGGEEDAFLVSVWLPGRGRNFSAGTFLYRPKLKQARELDYSQSLGLRYVTGYYADFVLLEQYASGQGSEGFTHALVRFSGWKQQVLHKASFGNNLGACGRSPAYLSDCEQTSVQFQMLAGSGKDSIDLVEVTTRLVGEDLAKGKLSIKSRRMRLIGDRFVAVKT